jgi:hypothetical protein
MNEEEKRGCLAWPPTSKTQKRTEEDEMAVGIKKKGFTLQRHNTENSKQIFPEKKLRGYSPNSYIHVPVSNL